MTDLRPPQIDPADAAAAAARFAGRAEPDVAYAVVDSPVGALVAAVTPQGLVRLAYEDFEGGVDEVLDSLAVKLSPRILEAPARLDAVRRELDEYFAGRRETFDVPIDWTLYSDFGRRVLQATAAIPFGHTATYGQMAAQAGNAKASRAAGRALGANAIPIVVPCHRVIGTSGKLTGYTGGMHRKEALLRLEGIAF
ncbi:MAG: methylated-DNA--[protein]-cysteine S-methyltransferase [Conexibacter sp.]|jgi:methylated-DNA-[protein]-cysteine S-methyltransferase|nr:methylated-DNA--[protein]-cysteine S-methyltransferase [Conexibacter sp.]MCZ4495174.1 methylated-DNA--[protein]-cysteine S-methyltransferase [Conexibacter sp.]MDX6714081.1 methylated-DNA-[protein]-cysteine S-methyltransferase [Baekduia sp.]